MSERLDARGIATFLPQTESFAQIDTMILGLGERTGHAREAKATVEALDARVAGIEKAVATRPRVRVLLVFGLQPISVAGPASFAEEMIRRAGGTNVVTEGGGYPTLGVERVHHARPGRRRQRGHRRGPRQRADQQGHAGLGDTSAPSWRATSCPSRTRACSGPGPRIGDGLATLARALHPDVVIP